MDPLNISLTAQIQSILEPTRHPSLTNFKTFKHDGLTVSEKSLKQFFVQEKEKINNKKKVTKHNNSASVVWKT